MNINMHIFFAPDGLKCRRRFVASSENMMRDNLCGTMLRVLSMVSDLGGATW